MPVPIPGPEVGSDSLKVEFLLLGIHHDVRGTPGHPTRSYIDQFFMPGSESGPRL